MNFLNALLNSVPKFADLVQELAPPNVDATGPAPEGGPLAWLTVIGSFCILFTTFGLQTSVGLIQIYLSGNELSQYSAFQVSWIPSVFIFLTLAASILAGALFDRHGPRGLLLFGSFGYVATFFLAAQCHTYWSFLLVLGILGGFSSAVLITVAQSVIAHWFDRRRGFAGGIAMVGSALGGVVFPLVLRYMLPNSGWTSAMYTLGGIVAVWLIPSIFLVRGRLRPSRSDSIISFQCFFDAKFLWTTLAIFGYELFVIAGWGLLPTVVLNNGYGEKHSFYIVIVIALGSIFGRVGPPSLADKYGRFNIMVLITAWTVIWLPLLDVGIFHIGVMYAVAFLFGLSSGAFVCLSATCIGQICESSVYGQWMGAADSVVSLATLISIPIGIALESAGGKGSKNGAFYIHGYLTGMLLISLLACVIARWGCLRWDRSHIRLRRIVIV